MGDWSLWQYMLLIDIWFYAVWIMSKLSLKKKNLFGPTGTICVLKHFMAILHFSVTLMGLKCAILQEI